MNVESSVKRLTAYSNHDHRRRLRAIQRAEQSVLDCGRKKLILDYLPGQASYQISEYPSLSPYRVDEYDEKELEDLAGMGVELLQIMEDWNDILRLHGADKFSSPNPDALRRFIDAAHAVGIRVLLYVSSGYMQYGDPDLDLSWTREPAPTRPQALHWKLMRCSPASPGWRAYYFEQLERVLGDWQIDGIYDDWGHRPPLATNPLEPTSDEILAWQETESHDAAKEDLLAITYARLKSAGAIFKLHADFNNAPLSDLPLYDYLWVGEGIGNLRNTLEQTKWHQPYVVPAFDTRFGGAPEQHKYLYSIPYLQFPQLFAGKALTGERAVVPGVEYLPESSDQLLTDLRAYRAALQKGAIRTPAYSAWDMSLDVDPDTRTIYARWLAVYRDLVRPGTSAYIDASSTTLVNTGSATDVVVSVFANLDVHLVVANFGDTPVTITTQAPAVDMYSPGAPSQTWTVPGQSLLALREVESEGVD